MDRVRMSQVMEVRIHLSTVRVGVIMVWRREHSTGMVTWTKGQVVGARCV